MSFEEEWARLKADAAARHSTHVRLNQLPGSPAAGGSDPQGDLRVDQKDLAAIGDAAYRLHQNLGRDGYHAQAMSYQAARGLKTDFAIGAALEHVTTRWGDQLRSLQGACAHISNHLDYTQHAHQGDETYLVTKFSEISTLDQGFNEGDVP
ncbi:hypothetical protein ABT174_36825 [Streptomyces sparsogenes]|uniref:hypothetical protein n=1 Tax=Streptomyces sparsogenes TaxID=67365 RepID=UPI00332E011C